MNPFREAVVLYASPRVASLRGADECVRPYTDGSAPMRDSRSAYCLRGCVKW